MLQLDAYHDAERPHRALRGAAPAEVFASPARELVLEPDRDYQRRRTVLDVVRQVSTMS
jgi:hypothetical protein